MFRKFSYTWELMGASWGVLKQDKELLVFPLISGICCLLVAASFAAPIWYTGNWHPPGRDANWQRQVVYYGVLFLFYLCNFTVITFFNTAIIAGAIERMSGGDPTFASCLSASFSRLPLIFGWAFVSATVGLVLRMIEDRSEKVGQFVAGLLGMAWSIASFLVVPILVAERKGPIDALKDSASLLKKTWGEQLVSNFSFGVVFFLLSLPAYLVIGFAVYAGVALKSIPLAVAAAVLGVVYLIVLALVQSALQSIFQAALYLHVREKLDPTHYPDNLLADAMDRRRR
ncbi:MAG: DUF6159 family protein [Isosphaerales bacterium]